MKTNSTARCSQHSLVVGVDPGRQRSGFVVARVWPTLGITTTGRMVNAEICDFLWSEPVVEAFVEDFRLRPWALGSMRWNSLLTVRMIGALEEVTRRRRIRLLEVEPAAAKRFATDELLIDLGTWSRNGHVNDAFRVLWYGLFKREANGEVESAVDDRITRATGLPEHLNKQYWANKRRDREPAAKRPLPSGSDKRRKR